MRPHDTVTGILLLFSIIDFILAAPVLVQENLQKRQACTDVVHTPDDVMSVLGKRGSEEISRVIEDLFGTSEELPDAHASSSWGPPGPDHGSSGLTPIAYSDALSESESDYDWLFDKNGKPLVPIPSPTPTESGSDHGMTGEEVPQPNPNPNPRPWTGPDPDFDWNYRADLEDQPPSKRPKLALSEESSQAHEGQVQQPNPGLSAAPDDLSPTSPDEEPGVASPLRLSDWHPMMAAHSPPPGPVSPQDSEEIDLAAPLRLADWHPMMAAYPPPPHPLFPTETVPENEV